MYPRFCIEYDLRRSVFLNCSRIYCKKSYLVIYDVLLNFLVHLSQRLNCTIVITHWPSSVRRPSLSFHIFDFSEIAEQILPTLDRKHELNVLYHVCFSDRSEKEVERLASDWLRHFRRLLLNHWTTFSETCPEAGEKGRDLTQSYDKSPYIQKNPKSNVTT